MFDVRNIDQFKKVTNLDYSLFGTYPRQAFDIYTSDLYGIIPKFSGFQMVKLNNGSMRVANGRYYTGGKGYKNDDADGYTLDLLSKAPAVNRIWAVVYVYGQEENEEAIASTYLTDTETRNTTARVTPQRNTRRANIAAYTQGTPSPDPQKPATPPGGLAIGYVLLGPSGIESFERATENEVRSVQDHDNQFREFGIWRAGISTSVAALQSNLAAVTARLDAMPNKAIVRSLARDVANIKEQLGFSDDLTGYGVDNFLSTREVNTGHIDWYATVEEGMRFPKASIKEAQIQLSNINDDSVVNLGGIIFPKFNEVSRLANFEASGSQVLSQYSYQTVQYVQKTMTRQRVRTGSWYTVCSNWLNYSGGEYERQAGIFVLPNGESVEVIPEDRALVGNIDLHTPVRVRQIWFDGYEDVAYTDTIVSRGSLNGSIGGNTFLAPQDGWMTSIDIAFESLGSNGDCTLVVVETSLGQPDFSKVIGMTTVAHGLLRPKGERTKFGFGPPISTKKGARLAWFIATPGNHAIQTSTGEKIAQGSFFQNTDGAWSMPDPTRDACFGVNYALWNAPRYELLLEPLYLEGGIANIDILAKMVSPSQTDLAFFVNMQGRWVAVNDLRADTNRLLGLPAQLPFKAVFQGTTDVMPCMGVGPNSRVVTHRPANRMRGISIARPQDAPVNSIEIETRFEAWRGAPYHTAAVRLRTGVGFNTIVAPAAEEDRVAPDDPNAIIRRSIFTLGASVSTFVVDTSGNTDNPLACFHVASQGYLTSFI